MTEQPKIALISSLSVSSHRLQGEQHLGGVWSRQQLTPSGDPSVGGHFVMHRKGNLFSLRCGQSSFTGMKLLSEVVPLQPMQFSTTEGGLRISGTEEVSASRVLDFSNEQVVLRHLINDNWGAPFKVPLKSIIKKKTHGTRIQ